MGSGEAFSDAVMYEYIAGGMIVLDVHGQPQNLCCMLVKGSRSRRPLKELSP